MNALLRVTIKVDAAEAAKLRAIAKDLAMVQTAARTTGGAFKTAAVPAELSRWQAATQRVQAAFAKISSAVGTSLVRIGKDMQWTGRQLEFRLTLPILAAGAAATKFALDNERSFTRLKKVYGSVGDDVSELAAELDLLQDAFRALSDIYGISLDQVIDIGAGWAQAGAQGAELAKITRATMDVMILGSMDAATATESLIQVMAGYRLSVEDLTDAIAVLNTVENETQVNFSDLIEVIERSAGVARNSGVSIRELASMTAALVPMSGTAQQVGNAIKSMANKIMVASGPTAEALRLLGVQAENIANLSLTERLELMAEGWSKLTQNEKVWVGANLATLYQSNRIVTLLDDLSSGQSRYRQAMDATADSQRNLNTLQREIGIYLASTPQAFDILTTRIKNMMAEAIVPLLPLLQVLLQYVVQAVHWFTNLDPATQKLIAAFVGFLAILGPVVAYIGVMFTAIGSIFNGIKGLIGVVLLLVKPFAALAVMILKSVGVMAALKAAAAALGVSVGGLVAIIVAVVAAVGLLAYAFRDELGAAIRWIWDNLSKLPSFLNQVFGGGVRAVIGALSALPRAVLTIFQAVIRIIAAAARAFYSWLSYFNPFARHSPSLVEQVQAGVAIIMDEYSKLGDAGTQIQALAEGFGAHFATLAGIYEKFEADDLNDEIESVSIFGQVAVDAYLGARQQIDQMNLALAEAKKAVEAQREVVEELERALEEANRQIDQEENLLQKLEADAESLEEAVSSARREIERLAGMSITGMGAYDDALFQNEMQQRQQDLIIAQRTVSLGGRDYVTGVDEEGNEVRIDDATIEAARRTLDMLRAEADVLRAQRDLQYDPQTREIDLLANPRAEMDFDDIISGIQNERATIDTLQPQLDEANRLVEEKRAYVDQLKLERDEIELKLDAEKAKLEELEEAYDAIESAINDMTAALDEFLSRAEQARSEAESAAAGGAGGVGGGGPLPGDWELPGGTGGLFGDGGELADLETLVAEWEAEAAAMFGAIDIDIAKWFSDLWVDIQGRFAQLGSNIGGFFGQVGNWLYQTLGLDRIDWSVVGNWFAGLGGAIASGVGALGNFFAPVVDFFMGLFGGDGTIAGIFTGFRETVGGVLSWIGERFSEFIQSDWWQNTVEIFSGIAQTIGTALSETYATISTWITWFVGAWSIAWNFVKIPFMLFIDLFTTMSQMALGVARGVWNTVFEVVRTALTAIWQVAQPILSMIWGVIRNTWDFVYEITLATWNLISGIVTGALEVVRGIITTVMSILRGDWEGAWNGIKEIFSGVWNIIVAIAASGRDVLLGIFNFILDVGRTIWNGVVDTIFGAGAAIATIIEGLGRILWGLWGTIWSLAETAWNGIKNGLIGIAGAIRDGIGAAISGIWGVVRGILNSVIDVANWFIRGINTVTRQFSIPGIPEIGLIGGAPPGASTGPTSRIGGVLMASGGVVPIGGGMKVNQATAIVGEGSKVWPEFVIPTDPQYRSRALAFLFQAMQKLGVGGMASGGVVPGYAIGGIIDWGKDRIDDIKNAAKTAASLALRAALAGPSKAFDLMVGALPDFGWFDWAKKAAIRLKNEAYTWIVNFGDTNGGGAFADRMIQQAISTARTATSTPAPTTTVRRAAMAADGGIARATRGGVPLIVAEGGRDEAIIPLPDGWERDGVGGKTVINIYGNLEFPNITDPADAEAFIRNLEALAS